MPDKMALETSFFLETFSIEQRLQCTLHVGQA
jgi:hypothetical protein